MSTINLRDLFGKLSLNHLQENISKEEFLSELKKLLIIETNDPINSSAKNTIQQTINELEK